MKVGPAYSTCSARCYEAKGSKCRCQYCHGQNHGVGLRAALENTEEQLDHRGREVLAALRSQLELWDEDEIRSLSG